MILPIITAISREVFVQTPRLHEEAALALGATRWEMIRYAVFPYARSGMVSGVMLGLGRALGETMAVAMVLATTPLTTLNVIGDREPADDRRQHRPELQGGDAGAAVAADRHRAGALRGDLPGQLRRPLDRRPQRSGGRRDDQRRDAAISSPRPAPLGAGAGRGHGPGRGRPARDPLRLERRPVARSRRSWCSWSRCRSGRASSRAAGLRPTGWSPP